MPFAGHDDKFRMVQTAPHKDAVSLYRSDLLEALALSRTASRQRSAVGE